MPVALPLGVMGWSLFYSQYLSTNHLQQLNPAQGTAGTLTFRLAIPCYKPHTAGNTGSSPPKSVMFYVVLPCLPRYLTFPPHYGDNEKVIIQRICLAIPRPAQGLGPWLQMTGPLPVALRYFVDRFAAQQGFL